MFYNKIAVINDNPIMLGHLLEILGEQKISLDNFYFFCSPQTQTENYRDLQISIETINLKTDYQELINTDFDLLISMHCKQIFPSQLIHKIKSINVHPGYNPINRGWYPQVFAIINKLDLGATIHEIDEFVDHGGIIDREKVSQHSWDTSYTLYNRVVGAEIRLLRKNISNILNNTYSVTPPENGGNYYSIKDFREICEINLQEKGDFKSFIDRLRALSHGDFKNAWFIDDESGKKVYVSIKLDLDGPS